MKRGVFLVITIILVAVAGYSFMHTTLTIAQYVNWMGRAENGHVACFDRASYVMELQHRTPELMAIHGASDVNWTSDKLEQEKKKYQDLIYFTLKMKCKTSSEFLYANAQSDDDYHKRNEYFSYEMPSDLYLITGNDTVQPCLYHFEHNYGAAPYNTAMFAFNKVDFGDNVRIIYDDSILGLGMITFEYETSDLNYSPIIKF